MLTVKQMLAKTRQTIHDEQELEYTDAELLNYLDDGNRLLRRTAMSIFPEVLVVSLEGYTVEEQADESGNNVEVPTDKIVSDGPFTRVLRVVVDGEKINAISRDEIERHGSHGKTWAYYLTGFDTINLFPAPECKHKYRVDYIGDLSLFELNESSSPYPLVLDDLLVEYAVLRSSISDEFNMQKETALISTIVEQIEDVLRNITRIDTQVEGYWNSGRRGRW